MFCRKCGKEIFDDSDYCEECRNASQSVAQTDSNGNAHKKCCPKCKSRNLQIVTNTEFSSQTKGGGYSTGESFLLILPIICIVGGIVNKNIANKRIAALYEEKKDIDKNGYTD